MKLSQESDGLLLLCSLCHNKDVFFLKERKTEKWIDSRESYSMTKEQGYKDFFFSFCQTIGNKDIVYLDMAFSI